jgi:hypothetical protein
MNLKQFKKQIIITFQNELREVEEKFRQAMVQNAGLDNEKSSLTYQVNFNFLKLNVSSLSP